MARKRDIFASAPLFAKPGQAKGKVRKLLKRAMEIQSTIEGLKPLYGELDRILSELVERQMGPVSLGGRTAMLVDNYGAKATQFKTVAFRRWDLRVT